MNLALAKKTILLFMILLFSNLTEAQNNSYESSWKAVDDFEKKGLPKSALEVVERIALNAKKDNNSAQIIKTMLFKSKYALVLEEDAQLKIITNFKTEIAKSEFPSKNILESILANLYWQYFQQNRYKFYNRTKTSKKIDVADFRTWDLQTLFDEVHLHFQNSLESGLLLQMEPLENYNALLNEQKNSKLIRPTLFDFLAHNALDFYKTSETNITKPTYKFEIDTPKYLGDAEPFSILNIESKDTTSLQLNTLEIYKNLIRFHLKDENPFALANVNIERLKFVHKHATFDDKDDVLLTALKSESDRLKGHEVSGLYDFEIAQTYYNQSLKYIPKKNETPQWKAKDAADICNAVITKYPKSIAAEKCKILQSQIKQPALRLRIEAFLPVKKEALILVNYKNFNALNFNVYAISERQYKAFNKTYRQDEQWTFIKTLKAIKTWESALKNEGDYQQHATELVLPKLDNGRYLIVASKAKNPETNFAFAHVQVTNMAVVETETPSATKFQIIDRNNGAAITNANIEVSYFPERIRKRETKTYTTNALGEVVIKKDILWYRDVQLKVEHHNEVAYFGESYINRLYKDRVQKTTYNGFLFTDRSIYRPGQTLYFKGIAIKTDEGKSEVLQQQNINVSLHNVNGEKLKTLQGVTNAFGSISGEFILPSGGLNGQFFIQMKSEDPNKTLVETQYFSVEEYKRPKFEAKFNPVKETFKINDSVTITGNALAYAGSTITDAKVEYRVLRKVEYPRWYSWYRSYTKSAPQEITYGETTTDASGNFKITFKALPDEATDKTNLPVFKYEVTADVTDINGETRSTSTLISVGYHALLAHLNIADRLDKTNKDHVLTIDTKNLNGEFTPAKGTIKIHKLVAPKATLRPRPWAAPDYQALSKTDFKNRFPFEAYTQEYDAIHWKKGTLVFETSFNTEISKLIPLGKLKKWASGTYVITLESKDKFGQLVKDEVRTTLYSDNDDTLADQQLFSITTDKPTYAIGDVAQITIGSTAKNIAVTIAIEKDKKSIKKEIITLNNNKRVISVPVTEKDLGGFAVRYSFAAFNSFQNGTEIIAVPYTKTELEIETLTFRDKLQPGTDETWQFKIKGPKGEKVSAELLASMYDASLDQFKPHQWHFNPIYNPSYNISSQTTANLSFGTNAFTVYHDRFRANYKHQNYDRFNWFGLYFGNKYNVRSTEYYSISKLSSRVAGVEQIVDDVDVREEESLEPAYRKKTEGFNKDKKLNASPLSNSENVAIEKPNFNNIKIRKNLQETAFFFPQLKTDTEGNISFSFTTPEALTQWKLQLVSHTKTLESATKTLTTVTQKELMVTPNAPRFLREGDAITISTKISNLTDKALSGQAQLILTDAISGKDISAKLLSSPSSGELEEASSFTVAASGNTQVSWNLTIPEDVQAVQYKIVAKAGDFSDGEQNALPVLSNRMLVTETLPMWVKSNQTRSFTLDKLKTNTSTTLKQHKLTLEMTSNPAWYAVQALPYLMEYPYECNEQTFSRYYANALARHIANSNPRIQEVFRQWRGTDALLSNLEKNKALKSILIQETPWLRDAQSETEQKKRISLLFDLNKMNSELQSAINKLRSNQVPSGAWSWFNGGRENRYITQHIIAGFGHLKQLNVIKSDSEESQMISKAINYLDAEFIKTYNDIRKYNAKVDLNKDHLSHIQLHYLYMRSFFPEISTSKKVEEIMAYYQSQIQKYWLKRSLYAKGMMALISYRNNDNGTTAKILNSLQETSITTEELGMYWKANTNSWYWYQAPIETQALLIEAFSEAGNVIQKEANNLETIDNLKIWLLKNKQTNKWKTTKATTEAVYALLLQGSDWLSVTDMVDVSIGGQQITPSKLEDVKVEAGTGYYKTSWSSSEITPEMGEVNITKKGKGIAWGSLYWQYFEDLDKITSAETPLSLKKNIFLKTNTAHGEEISEITNKTHLKVGDLLRVRIELRSDRNMEFLHMKDMRASGLEPVNIISNYKWQDGLGYYESTKDAATNFFFDYLPKGVYVFEYDLRVNNAGNMSNGITTIQSMYAPEFSSHSEGNRILVD
ncbi:alpha-2-macroglobulin family protein [Hyunsoonleella sp. 2307UL5-6]|uniref:alpha-2-macroglobulin family protein n=1 Tax=Hyunsoonleella sp. 2307UL5-6 TaxID=3384768 RepID=UPI0039BD915A